jgi:UDP-N-acetylglucosamine transferase subunit ALG13
MQGRYSIFASVGNATQPFDRFLRMVDEAAARVKLPALVQTGAGAYRPRHADTVGFVGREEFDRLCLAADHVITHAGVGSVMTAVRLGKVPIVVPRRRDLGEVVNDHQFELAAELSKMGWCRVAGGIDDLVACLVAPPPAVPRNGHASNRRMRELVSDFIS